MSDGTPTPQDWIRDFAWTLHNEGYLKMDAREAATMSNDDFVKRITYAARAMQEDAAAWRTRPNATTARDAASTFLLTIIASNTHSHAERIEAATLLLQVKP